MFGCQDCSDHKTCSRCRNNLVYRFSSCVCPPQHHLDTAQERCVEITCSSACRSCALPQPITLLATTVSIETDLCTSCWDPLQVVIDFRCECPRRHYRRSETQCALCDRTCEYCSGPSQHECLACAVDSDRVLSGGQCVCANDLSTSFDGRCRESLRFNVTSVRSNYTDSFRIRFSEPVDWSGTQDRRELLNVTVPLLSPTQYRLIYE